jgi:hypothetical protein
VLINRQLNLIIPVERADKSTMFVHSTPISSQIFDTYFLPIAKAFSAIYAEGLGPIAGPRIADKMLKKVSMELGVWEGSAGVQNGLVNHIEHATNILTVGKAGWEMIPYYDAKAGGLIDPDDVSEVDAAITFFILASAMHRRAELKGILDGAMSLWGAQTESLSCTEYLNSLRTSTAAANSGATVAG